MGKLGMLIVGILAFIMGLSSLWVCITHKNYEVRDIHGKISKEAKIINKMFHYSNAILTIFTGIFFIWLGIVYNE